MIGTARKYTLLKVRIKIGYHAFMRRLTVCELFLGQITKSFTDLHGQPKIYKNQEILQDFDNLLRNGGEGFVRYMLTQSVD